MYRFRVWVKEFKNEPSKICGRKPLKKFEVIRYARFGILELRNRVTQYAVTFQIINSKHFQVNNST